MAKKILLVEDNAVNMRLVKLTLKNDDYEFIEAVNGEEALEQAAQERPDIIILDIQIPKLDGYEVTKRLKADAALSKIPIIALTAHAMKGDEERILGVGCNTYVSKPLDTHAFRDLVKKYLYEGV